MVQKEKETYTEYWHRIRSVADAILSKNSIPSLGALINLIKKINPTPHIHLSFEEKDEAYRLKTELQSLLLLHYGQNFVLEPSKWDNDVVLLRSRLQPTVNACHAKKHKLSVQALDNVCTNEPATVLKKCTKKKRTLNSESSTSLNDHIKRAEEFARGYDYENTVAILTNLFIGETNEILIFLKGLDILVENVCAYDKAMDILLALPENIKRDTRIREALADVYWLQGLFIDARGLFEECNIKELKKNSIYKYAYILHKEKENGEALELINYAETLPGYEAGFEGLKEEVTKQLKDEASCYYERAKKEFENNYFDQAEVILKEAIRIYSDYSEAKELLRLLRGFNSEQNIAALWNQFHSSIDSEKRIRILKKIQSADVRNRESVAKVLKEEIQKDEEKKTTNLLLIIDRCLENQNYKDTFDAIYHLSENQRNFIKPLIIVKYPILNSLLINEKVWRLKFFEGRDCWLAYIEATTEILPENENNIDKTLLLLKKASRAFSQDMDFIKLHDRCKSILANKSRQRIDTLLVELTDKNESFESREKIAKKIYIEARNLLEAESDEYKVKVESILNRLNVSQTKDYHVRCLRKSLLSGDTENAEEHRKKIGDKSIVQKISDEVSELFNVDAKTINVDLLGHHVADDSISLDFVFLNAIEDDAFFQNKKPEANCLIKYNFKKRTANEYRIPKLNLTFLKIIDKNDTNMSYSLLCKDNESDYYYVEFLADLEYKVLKYINLSDLLDLKKIDEPIIYNFFYLSGNSRCLYISFKYSVDDVDYRLLSCVDLKRNSILRTAKVECFLDTPTLIMLPTDPPCILAGESNHLRKYNDKFKTIVDVVVEKNALSLPEKIEIDREKKQIYCVLSSGANNDPEIIGPCFFNLKVLDWNLVIIKEFSTDLNRDDFVLHDIYYDPVKNFLYFVTTMESGIVYDCTSKRILKELAPGNYACDKNKAFYLFNYSSENNIIYARKLDIEPLPVRD